MQALRGVHLLLRVLDALPNADGPREPRVARKGLPQEPITLGVDLKERLRSGRMLSDGELAAIVRACSHEFRELRDEDPGQAASARKVVRLESARMRGRVKPPAEVKPSTKFVRLHYIRKYLLWCVNRALLRLEPSSSRFEGLALARDAVDRVLVAQMPPSRSRNTEDQRQGLAAKDLKRLLAVIDPSHPDNPWRADTRVRNNLMVRWYLHTGLRRSELLVVNVSDINFQTGEVLVARRPDDPNDTRRNLPSTKTNDKVIPLRPDLVRDTHKYVTEIRRLTGIARKHAKLFVATSTGEALSTSAVNLIFTQLRKKVPNLPDDLTPHVLRHSWNDQFSELADEQGYEPAEEAKMRSRLMGWSETSGTAAQYTRRHTRRKSREASLALQAKLDPKEGKKQ